MQAIEQATRFRGRGARGANPLVARIASVPARAVAASTRAPAWNVPTIATLPCAISQPARGGTDGGLQGRLHCARRTPRPSLCRGEAPTRHRRRCLR